MPRRVLRTDALTPAQSKLRSETVRQVILEELRDSFIDFPGTATAAAARLTPKVLSTITRFNSKVRRGLIK